MIKVNLLPVKKKRRARQMPTFLILSVVISVVTAAVLAYAVYSLNAQVTTKKRMIAENEKKIAQLKEKIKAVADYEKRNEEYRKRRDLVEKLSRNRTIPVEMLDEVSSLLPKGVWLRSLSLSGDNVSLMATGFTNTDVVQFVNNCKHSKMFADVYLIQSVQTKVGEFSAYNFDLKFKVKT